jgi:glycine/D-amino acid oxidase-like deaminating enzyme
MSQPPYECEVVIVGAGVAGASAAYHLMKAGVRNIVVLDAGPCPGEGSGERKSGSAVLESAGPIKMMVQVFASSCDHFIAHHGEKGARRYLSLTAEGLEIQKALAKQVLQVPQEQLLELGSFYIGYEKDEDELRREFDMLRSLGCTDIEWYDKYLLERIQGCSPDFYCAIFFPKDGVIDSSSYAKGLLNVVQTTGAARLFMETKVTRVTTTIRENNKEPTALVELESGARIFCKHAVVATGGLFQMPQLCGILTPCYSYLVHVPISRPAGDRQVCKYSSNFFTWGFSHDWCWTHGKVRCSGEDHFSAYKPPLVSERCASLIRWTQKTYSNESQSQVDLNDIPQQYGVYSETPDSVPLVGHIGSESRVCYLVGCNAWGQTVLTYCASLAPALLRYKELDKEQRDNLELLSIGRFSLLPS